MFAFSYTCFVSLEGNCPPRTGTLPPHSHHRNLSHSLFLMSIAVKVSCPLEDSWHKVCSMEGDRYVKSNKPQRSNGFLKKKNNNLSLIPTFFTSLLLHQLYPQTSERRLFCDLHIHEHTHEVRRFCNWILIKKCMNQYTGNKFWCSTSFFNEQNVRKCVMIIQSMVIIKLVLSFQCLLSSLKNRMPIHYRPDGRRIQFSNVDLHF